ncbi:chemotaxis-specific protein-glutamate methyltransferase CheB [Anaerolineales bacterium HSG24]|nr:chemotaxis-specific protein-glutamate methyltransferase CheB [Anaerolineales bacterium HSG24]
MNKNKKIRIVIVEDSFSYRELLATIFQSTPDMEVVGKARDGLEGIDLAVRLKPNIVTMDIHMPNMDGFEATRQIMTKQPCPIIMISASFDPSQRHLTFEALRAGALSIIDKPTLFAPPQDLEKIVTQVRLMSEVKVIRRWNSSPTMPTKTDTLPITAPSTQANNPRIVAIAASTGGPGLLARILTKLPANFPVPVLIVQHITPGFGVGLAEWLNQQTPLDVVVATEGLYPKRRQVVIAPDDHHMEINRQGKLTLHQSPPLYGVRPSADYMFKSMAKIYGRRAIGVILTGMGQDGAEGLLDMYKAGAHTIAQDKESSVVFGMPAVAIELGAVIQILPDTQIATTLNSLCPPIS